MRFSLRSILDGSFPGEGVSLWRGVLGLCPGCPEGGEGWRGLVVSSICSPVLPGKGLRPLHSMNKSRTLDPPLCY